jgi:SNF2 family DNA or RNA helicase
MDIFPQYLFIDRGETFGGNFWKFRRKYFIDKGWGRFQKWVLNPKMADEFIQKVDEKCIRFLKSECLDLPSKLKQKLYIHLTHTQMNDYQKLMIGDGDLDVGKLTRQQLENCLMKYSQITGGFLKDKEGEYQYYERNPKLETLIDLIKDAIDDTKVTIFHRFVAEGRMIEGALKEEGIPYASMRSEVKDTTKEYEKFRNDDRVRVMVAHPQSGGIGLNFTNSALCIYYSTDYSIESQLQSEDRLHRIGQEKNVTYIHLLARHTIDEEIWRAQAEGISLIDRINNYKLSYDEIIKGGGMRWKEEF